MAIDLATRVGGAILLAEMQWKGKAGVSKEAAMGRAALEAMADHASAFEDAVRTIINAVRLYLPPDGTLSADDLIKVVVGAVDNDEIATALHDASPTA